MTTVDTPDEIRYAQLASAKGAIKLEKLGLRHSRLGKNGVKKSWAAHYNLGPRATHDEVIAKIKEEMQALLNKKQQELPL